MAPRGKKQSDINREVNNTLKRARLARDAALWSIKKLAELSRDMKDEVENVRYLKLGLNY